MQKSRKLSIVSLLCFSIAMMLIMAAPATRSENVVVPSVYVVNSGDGTVSLVDLKQLKELRKIDVGSDPYGIALTQDGKTLVVGVEGEGKLKFFDTKDFKQKGELPIGKMFHDHMMLTKDGKHFLVAEYVAMHSLQWIPRH